VTRPVVWALRLVFALAAIAVGGVAWVYAASEAHLRSFARPPVFALAVDESAAAIARGDHLVLTRGCRGCHGPDLEGQPMFGTAVAVNLRTYAHRESVATFEAALRHAIGANGRALYYMPSFSFARLRDADVADVYAYLRSLPEASHALPSPSLPWNIRYDLARGADQAIPGFLPLVPPLAHQQDADAHLARGEYLAMTTCIECHGFSLHADAPFPLDAPPLLIVAGYDESAFRRLMKTGRALGDRELPRMSGVARGRFVNFTDDEVGDLYAFLRDFAARETAAH
jgi:mono/diheme cytochrome c family protein